MIAAICLSPDPAGDVPSSHVMIELFNDTTYCIESEEAMAPPSKVLTTEKFNGGIFVILFCCESIVVDANGVSEMVQRCEGD